MSAPLPPGLEAPPAGHRWTRKSARGETVWSLEPDGGDAAAEALRLIEHRRAWYANEAAEIAARELESAVSERAAAALKSVPSDTELAINCEGLSDARSALVRTVAWVALAQRRLVNADERGRAHRELEAKRDSIRAELQTLEAEVKAAFARYNEYDADAADKPDSRDVDRTRLTSALSSAEWECTLHESDKLMVAAAAQVVRELQSRLPTLRSKVLIESIAPAYLEQVRAIAGQLIEPLSVLCSLGEVDTTQSVRSKLDLALTMPLGRSLDISARPNDAATD